MDSFHPTHTQKLKCAQIAPRVLLVISVNVMQTSDYQLPWYLSMENNKMPFGAQAKHVQTEIDCSITKIISLKSIQSMQFQLEIIYFRNMMAD